MRIINDEKGRACARFTRSPRCLRVPPLVLMSYEVMRLIKDDKGRACARFARSPTRRLAKNWFHRGDPRKGVGSDGVVSSMCVSVCARARVYPVRLCACACASVCVTIEMIQ